MEYTFQQEADAGLILVTIWGDWNIQQDQEVLKRIMETVSQTKIRKVLIDMRQLPTEFSTFYIYTRAEYLKNQREQVETPIVKVAILYDESDPRTKSAFEFFETSTRNRSMPYRVFPSMEQARRWLAED
jgi:hypothetical protein